ncbi:hypothetical protein AGLY_006046, partial [Aphis glycines]
MTVQITEPVSHLIDSKYLKIYYKVPHKDSKFFWRVFRPLKHKPLISLSSLKYNIFFILLYPMLTNHPHSELFFDRSKHRAVVTYYTSTIIIDLSSIIYIRILKWVVGDCLTIVQIFMNVKIANTCKAIENLKHHYRKNFIIGRRYLKISPVAKISILFTSFNFQNILHLKYSLFYSFFFFINIDKIFLAQSKYLVENLIQDFSYVWFIIIIKKLKFWVMDTIFVNTYLWKDLNDYFMNVK